MINEPRLPMDEQNAHHAHPLYECYTKNCLSWRAVIAGALVATGLTFLLNLFGLAIGLSAFTNSPDGIKTLAIGGFVGMLIGSIVTMYFAGWVSGLLGRSTCHNRHYGALYGLLTWCLALIFTILLASSLSTFMSNHYRAMSNSNPTSTLIIDTTNSVTPSNINPTAANNPSSRLNTATKENAANNLGVSLFLTFLVFFAGAAASCFGGYHGLKPKKINPQVEDRRL